VAVPGPPAEVVPWTPAVLDRAWSRAQAHYELSYGGATLGGAPTGRDAV